MTGRRHCRPELLVGRRKLFCGFVQRQGCCFNRVRLAVEHLRYAVALGPVLGFLKSRGSFGYLLIECVQSIVYCDPLLLGIPHFRICLFEALLIAIGYDQLAANC